MTVATATRFENPAAPAASSASYASARARLDRRATLWRRRPLVRDIYGRYHEMIRTARSTVPGTDLELGAGHGSFAETLPGVVACDIIPCPWLDCAADAGRLPFRGGSLSNIIMLDVLHHVHNPSRFFAEAGGLSHPAGEY